jgi:hypothetical protein
LGRKIQLFLATKIILAGSAEMQNNFYKKICTGASHDFRHNISKN